MPLPNASDNSPEFPVPLCRADALAGDRWAFDVAGESYLLIAANGQLQVVEGACPHQYFPLEFGDVDADGILSCPLHGWRFRLSTGQSPDTPQICLRRWPAEIRDGYVYVAN